ncbi:class I SAM-dependent methyltransferase [Methanoculleus receptaculi]|uniref:Class I SAM-dependent methyltransferase n=1 Tax=Methanoculleus receptaculi TaxID=394967 RepID=A0AAX4FTA1_9EURY|nr:class I SAM-dependent methyltransferase [Methanoculleus receptaculi]MDI3507704.1 hypothetical protein [Methanomicrobiaceae archaeon]MDK2863047.1 hypothetical protein [Methanomicrobiaceae archaeon]WOX57157.1 class I SAM-dependent methyltransferase [Methanoculleus receptaculi]
MTADPSTWDEDYRRRGSLWGGAPAPLPEIPADATVLELGCGNGKTLAALAQRSLHVIAVEISREALLLARRHPATAAAGFVLADARHLPFRDGVFDMVFLVHLAGHLPARDRLTLASEVRRVLAAGGALIFRAFSIEDMRAGKGVEVEPKTFRRGSGIITHYFTETEALELFAPLVPVSLRTDRWQMRVRGTDLPRAEVEGVFLKGRGGSGR